MTKTSKSPEWKSLDCIDISDVHLGHPHTPTDAIIERLDTHLSRLFETSSIRFLFVSGDFFDRLLTLPSVPVKYIQTYITRLLLQCKLHHVKLRVLEGTPSHDWKQNYLFIQLNQDGEIGADVRYYDSPTIDYEEEEDLHILYIPDEWDEDTKETERQVLALLEEKGLETVDLAIMHGMFHFQVPENLHTRLPLHDQTVYERIVKHLILIGHHHTHRTHGKVVVPGSFDRLAHGEEVPKGFIHFTLYPKRSPTVRFIENTLAETYLSLDLGDTTAEEALLRIRETIETLRPYAKLRLVYPEHHPITNYLTELTKEYTEVIWSKPKVIKEEKKVDISTVLQQQQEVIVLRPENLEEKLLEELRTRFPESDTATASRLIRKVMQNA